MGKIVQCKCGREVEVDREDIKEVLCWECVQKSVPAPEIIKKADAEFSDAKGFPKGWKWMKRFVHADGRVFERGEESKKLRGTLEATPILLRSERRRIRDAKDLKMQARLANVYKLKRKRLKQKK